MAINKVLLIGNVGRDPEIRTVNNGGEIALFSLATTDSWKDKSTGERKDKTEWHRIVVYNSGLVGIVKSYVKKGSKLYIEGSLQTRKWVDNQGVERQVTEVVLQGYNCNIQMLDSKPNSNSNSDYGYSESFDSVNMQEPTPDATSSKEFIEEVIDDDIPF